MAFFHPACSSLGSSVETATWDRRQLAEPKLATVLLNDLAKKGQLEAAWRVLALLEKQGVANVIHVNTLISATSRCEDWEGCLSLLAELRPKTMHPTVVSFNSVLKVLAARLRWRLAAGLLQDMHRVRIRQDIISLNTVLTMMNRAGRWRDGHALMDAMLPATLAPDVFSITSCLQVQNWKVATSIFDEYQGPIDTAGVNALIGLSHSYCWLSSLHVLFSMSARRVDTTRRSWNAYSFQRHWRFGISAIQEPEPDVISFNSAASACEKQDLWGLCLELFSTVRMMGLRPEIVSYNCAMFASARRPWSGMVVILDEMLTLRIHPDGGSYVAALSGKNMEGSSLANTLLKHMSMAQVEKDATIVGALIANACQSEGRWQTALSWLLSLTPKLDKISCGTVISTFEKAQLWKESLELCLLQKEKRIQLDVIGAGATLSALACETCQWRLPLHFLSQTCQTLQWNRASYTATMGACILAQEWERTVSVLNHMTDLSLEADIATNHLAARAWADRMSVPFVAVMTTMSEQLFWLLSVGEMQLNSCDFHLWEMRELSLILGSCI